MNDKVLQSKAHNIQLVGCAKNEAAYLPEWIFYHLDIGFSSIKIYVNNTDDNSLDVLDKIIKHYPEVSYVVADSLISTPPQEYKEKTNNNFYNTNKVQAVVYTDALCRRNYQSIEYIAFLDIDEFFLPQKPLNEIFPTDNSNEHSKRFKWLLLSGDTEEFCTLAKCTKGYIDQSFKSVVPNRDVEIRAEDPHRFSINGDIGSISNDAVVLHRVLRSQKEYLYLLSRSTSNERNKLANGFKKNRRGWTDKGQCVKKYKDLFCDNEYERSFLEFIEQCDISPDLNAAKEVILKKHKLIVENINTIKQQNLDLTRSLGGIGVSHIDLFKTGAFSLFWALIRLLSPRLILSHETIKDALIKRKSKE
ncbi:MAG: hypothetical protein ACJA0H_001602 [Francisellaceae bacterium]|jgi:hypothetical protein